MNIHRMILQACLLLLLTGLVACQKFLEEKPDQKLVIPRTLEDLASILENTRINQWDPASGERCSDNYYLTFEHWQGLSSEYDRRAYIWEKERLFAPGIGNEWAYTYDNVYRSNIVLSLVDEINAKLPNATLYRQVKGSALFVRGRSYWNALQVWAKAYDAATADTDPGVPLRLDPDFNIATRRASIEACYSQVIADLKQAIDLLPEVAAHAVRPSKPAAMGLLARVYLSMRQYDSAFAYANQALQLKSDLLDFNSIANPTVNFPIARFNPEVWYDANMLAPTLINYSRAKMDSLLMQSYAAGDLRRTVYYRNNGNGSYGFKASYSGNNGGFSGIAANEVYLMRAECFARAGKVEEAMEDLNHLLRHRWHSSNFVPLTATTAGEALEVILQERRKELIMRGLRWMDIKRLNKEGYAIQLKRVLNGETYLLPPNDPRYALPIPEDVIEMTGIEQN